MDTPPDKADLIADEYREFVRIVSHDLDAPLRHVKEFTRMLIDARPGEPGEDEKEIIGYLESALANLAAMQLALLAYSRVNSRREPLSPTDCNSIVARALNLLADTVETRPTAIDCGDLPTIMADPPQLQSLFLHLLENALKFHAEGTGERKISIAASDDGEMVRFDIGDNGIGVAPNLQENVFRLFCKMNGDTYPGIGAGLTIARKIVERHGGKMAIDSAVGAGTTVSFWLPR